MKREEERGGAEEKLRQSAKRIEPASFASHYSRLRRRWRQEQDGQASTGAGQAGAATKARNGVIVATAAALLLAIILVLMFLFANGTGAEMTAEDETWQEVSYSEGVETDAGVADDGDTDSVFMTAVTKDLFYEALMDAGIEIVDFSAFCVIEYGLITDDSDELIGGYVELEGSEETEALTADITFYLQDTETQDAASGYSYEYIVGDAQIFYNLTQATQSEDVGGSDVSCEAVAYCGDLIYEISCSLGTDEVLSFFDLLFA